MTRRCCSQRSASTPRSITTVLLEFIESRPVVYLEARSSGAFLDEPGDVALFADAVERMNQLASDPAASGEIIAKYMKQYESEAP